MAPSKTITYNYRSAALLSISGSTNYDELVVGHLKLLVVACTSKDLQLLTPVKRKHKRIPVTTVSTFILNCVRNVASKHVTQAIANK